MNSTTVSLIRLLRPQQWVKNLFLFAPLVFSKHLFDWEYVVRETLAFVVFCLLSSCVYIINDIADREADRHHPLKRNRPLAAQTLSIPLAVIVAILLLGVAFAASLGADERFHAVAALYVLMNILYSLWLKHLILVDVFFVAAGFMIRVLAGVYAIGTETSHWLILCTLFVSLFLAISKRRGELVLSQQSNNYGGRAVLREYSTNILDQMMTIAASGMAISYALYTVAGRTVHIFGTENLIFTTVFVLFGIFRYFFLVRKFADEDNIVRLLVRDVPMLFNIAAWFIVCVLIIYSHEITRWFL